LNEIKPGYAPLDSVQVSDEAGHQFMARKLREAQTPVTVLMTGPASNLAAALSAEPELADKIAEVVWMGGALDVAVMC
jgi:purine nucleosidase